MKKPSIFGAILLAGIFISQPVIAGEEKSHDGYWWPCLGNDKQVEKQSDVKIFKAACNLSQIGYLNGYADGLSYKAGLIKVVMEILQSKVEQLKNEEDRKRFDTVSTMLAAISEPQFAGMTVGQIREGVTIFYSDFRNKQIDINMAIHIVQLQVRGEKKEFIECTEESARLQAQGKSREAVERTTECSQMRD